MAHNWTEEGLDIYQDSMYHWSQHDMYNGHSGGQPGHAYQGSLTPGHSLPPIPTSHGVPHNTPGIAPPIYHPSVPQYPSSSPPRGLPSNTTLLQVSALDPTQGFRLPPNAIPATMMDSNAPAPTQERTIRRSPRKHQSSTAEQPGAEIAGMEVPTPSIAEHKPKAAVKGRAAASKKAAASGDSKPKSQKRAKKAKTEDDEIRELDEKALKDVAIRTATPLEGMTKKWTAPELLAMVEYICEPKRWPTFKVKQAAIFREIAANIVTGKTEKQTRDKWNALFKMYKIIVRWEKHTGGWDGDEDRAQESDDWPASEEDSKEKATADGDGSDEESANESTGVYDGEPLVDEKETEVEARAGTEGHDSQAKPQAKKKRAIKQKGFSEKQLDDFRNGELYPIIDAVANTSPDVNRTRTFSSAIKADGSEVEKKPSINRKRKASQDATEELTSGGSNALVEKALAGMETRHKENIKLKEAELELAARRDKREEEETKWRQEREENEAKMREQREAQKHNLEQWQKVEQWGTSSIPALRAKAKQLADQLMAEEGITI
ncbi:hypothetical protein FRC00_008614 [Tulasnella sp. 408]|nr:hypothetical protein FRC00_008614 [Tulasnella sp. 408]